MAKMNINYRIDSLTVQLLATLKKQHNEKKPKTDWTTCGDIIDKAVFEYFDRNSTNGNVP